MTNEDFYQNAQVIKVEWWLSWCHEYPDLFWGRLRVFSNGKADVVFQDEDKTYGFINKESAQSFLGEDEFSAIENIDDDDKRDLEIPFDFKIETPNWAEKNFENFIFIGEY